MVKFLIFYLRLLSVLLAVRKFWHQTILVASYHPLTYKLSDDTRSIGVPTERPLLMLLIYSWNHLCFSTLMVLVELLKTLAVRFVLVSIFSVKVSHGPICCLTVQKNHQIKNHDFILSSEGSFLYYCCYVQLVTYGRRIPYAELFARIDAVDSSTVKRVAKRFIEDKVIPKLFWSFNKFVLICNF